MRLSASVSVRSSVLREQPLLQECGVLFAGPQTSRSQPGRRAAQSQSSRHPVPVRSSTACAASAPDAARRCGVCNNLDKQAGRVNCIIASGKHPLRWQRSLANRRQGKGPKDHTSSPQQHPSGKSLKLATSSSHPSRFRRRAPRSPGSARRPAAASRDPAASPDRSGQAQAPLPLPQANSPQQALQTVLPARDHHHQRCGAAKLPFRYCHKRFDVAGGHAELPRARSAACPHV